MPQIDFQKAEIFVIAHDKGIRQSLKSVLYSKGFRIVQFADSLDLIQDSIDLKGMPNLLITDVDIPEQDAIRSLAMKSSHLESLPLESAHQIQN